MPDNPQQHVIQSKAMLIDIHTHTYPTSDDSTLTPEELIIRAKLIGLDGVCLTDHDGVYGLTEYIFGMHKSAFVKDLVEEAGGAIVVAHPYRRVYRETAPQDETSYGEMVERGLRNEVFDIVDAIEIRNGRGTVKENAFSETLANKLDMPRTGASDAHKLADIGTYATEFYDKITGLSDLIKSIKSGRYDAKELDYCPPIK